VEDNPASGVYRVSRDIFTDPEIFELEMRHIFEGNWIYLVHESQIPNRNDYFTTYMGRQPIVIARDRNGELNAFINACGHRGAMLCRFKRGNKVVYTRPFQGWTLSVTVVDIGRGAAQHLKTLRRLVDDQVDDLGRLAEMRAERAHDVGGQG
jgi:hypothetical protein